MQDGYKHNEYNDGNQEDTYDTDAQSLSLLAAFQARYAPPSHPLQPTDTGVLRSASFITSNAIDVHIPMLGIQSAARHLHALMLQRPYSPATWHSHELHPSLEDMGGSGENLVNFIFTMDLLNFSFWSDFDDDDHRRWAVEYRGRRWTGYWGLVAALRRAIDEAEEGGGVLITDPALWTSDACTLEAVQHVFRSATAEPMPMLEERWQCLRGAGEILDTNFSSSVSELLATASDSAVLLINTLTNTFPCFNDTHSLDEKPVHFHKRAQIFVADLWACFSLYPESKYGKFEDVDGITMFADYRIPQMLRTLGCLEYSPSLEARIRRKEVLRSGSRKEVEIRGSSVWAVECLRKEIVRSEDVRMAEDQAERDGAERREKLEVNAILIDFFLYDLAKEKEAEEKRKRDDSDSKDQGQQAFEHNGGMIPHHRTRSIWY